MKLRYIIFLSLMGLFFKLCAQQHEIGLVIGSGKANLKDEIGINTSQNTSNFSFISSELSYGYTPKNAFFKFNTGVNYSHRELTKNNIAIDYIKLPLQINFVIGKQVQPIIGGGVYFASILNKKNENSNALDFSLFQFGASLKLGIGFLLSQNIKIALSYNINKDIIPIYYEKNVGKFQNEKSIVRGVDNFFSISIYYMIIK